MHVKIDLLLIFVAIELRFLTSIRLDALMALESKNIKKHAKKKAEKNILMSPNCMVRNDQNMHLEEAAW